MPENSRERVETETYRRLSEDIAHPIALLATRQGSWDLITPVDSFVDVSYDPPTMLVSLYSESRAAEAVEDSGSFALTVLSDSQAHLAERYGEPGLPLQGMLQGVEHTRDRDSNALISGGIASFSLRVLSQYQAATHTLFVCEVSEAVSHSGRLPLVRFSKHWLSVN